ncbi:MAG: WD40/YVTN/BNR-like repeat-containing protein [Nocardioidaceae bacterium]
MAGRSRPWKLIMPLVAVFALIIGVGAFFVVKGSVANEKQEAINEHGSKQMAEALDRNPSLASHRLPLAYVAEKLDQNGGEASGEILNGPSQQEYDQRAYPHTYIAPQQQTLAAQAFTAANLRGKTASGQALLRQTQGTAKTQTWTPLGPDGGLQAPETTYTGTPAIVSGRTSSLAVGTPCSATSCVLYAGTAGGGVWKTTSAMSATPRWSPIGADIPSNAIGTVYIAPNGDLYVGTGEANGSSDNEAGVGLFKSTDGGATFAKVPTFFHTQDFTLNRSISSVAVDPHNAQHMYVGTMVGRHGASSVNGGRFTPPGAPKIGVYETTNAGRSWHKSLTEASDSVDPRSPNGSDFFRGGISKILFDPTHAGTVYAAMFDYGLFRRVGSGAWQQIYTIHTPGAEATSSTSRVEFALASLTNGKTRIYLGDSTYFNNSVAGLLRTDDATSANPTWRSLSNPNPGTPGYGSYNFCEAQCYYDMVVSSPAGQPDQVFLAGSMNYNELQAFGGPGDSNGRAVVRSTDAGKHFTDMTNDAQPQPNGLHPDHHALVFAPGTSARTFFTASDGGVVRQSGPFVNRSADCVKRGLSGVQLKDCKQYLSAIPTENNEINTGLATLQFQSVTAGKSPRVLQGGTQDNGTWESDTTQGWSETVGGDGGQSGFNVDNSNIRYHSYYSPSHDVSFTGGSPTGWDYISDPLVGSGESASFYTPFTADPVVGGTVFDGLQHVWRTTDNGGPRKFLDKYCNELTGDYGHRPSPCGDWKPLGGAHGDLSSTYWGSNTDAGNYVVAVERPTTNKSTMWAATRYGRVFISQNANAANPSAVTYQRIDQKLNLPQRFVSGIAIDPANPYHAFISYSGYSAYSPGGHVYEVTWNPKTNTGTARDLSLDLGDQPVTDIVYVPRTQALFISTDFGVLTRAMGGHSWVATQGLPKVAVYGLTLSRGTKKLIAATHGRSIWSLPVNS